ncbi:carboxypeptidase [bacterium]|nr:carboxypeptidase [bacterium]
MMRQLVLIFPLLATLVGFGFVSCGSDAPVFHKKPPVVRDAEWLRSTSSVTWLPRQVSGRYDGASALDNIRQAAAGNAVKRSSYGTAPGGYVRLDPRMLRAMKSLAKEGYTFRVTALAGASHSRTSRHYAGLAFDVDMINGRKVGYSNPYWRKFLARCRAMGATETLGPGDRAHSTHIHAAWPR